MLMVSSRTMAIAMLWYDLHMKVLQGLLVFRSDALFFIGDC
jgi:hypothetical protein